MSRKAKRREVMSASGRCNTLHMRMDASPSARRVPRHKDYSSNEGAYLQNSWKVTSPERSVSIAMNCAWKRVATHCCETTATIESSVFERDVTRDGR
jgi:hypothetical protein